MTSYIVRTLSSLISRAYIESQWCFAELAIARPSALNR